MCVSSSTKRSAIGGSASTTTALRLSLGRLEQLGISAGQTYDGLIAMTAASHDATLLTLDRRAQRTYALVGADVELVA